MNRRDFIKCGIAGGTAMMFSPNAFAEALATGNQTVVLGGGAFALGYALAHPNEVIVLERGIHLASDFALAGEPEFAGTPTTTLGCELLNALKAVGIVANGKMELPPLSDFMAEFFAAHGGMAFMHADLVELEKRGNLWQLTIFGGGEGLTSFNAAGFLDTTSIGWRNLGADAIIGKRLAALTDKGYFKVHLPPAATWHEARMELHRQLDVEVRKGTKVYAEAGAFKFVYGDKRIERRTQLGYRWIPSSQFGSLISAFEEGLKWQRV